MTFSTPLPQDRAALPPIRQAVQILGDKTDLSGLIWLRNRGGRMLARVNEGGVFRVYQVSIRGVMPAASNWPRALHEGQFRRRLVGPDGARDIPWHDDPHGHWRHDLAAPHLPQAQPRAPAHGDRAGGMIQALAGFSALP